MKNILSKLSFAFLAVLVSQLIFAQAPTIIVQPISGEKCVGNSITISLIADGETPLVYLWFHDGVPVGTNSNEYVIASAQISDHGYYYCEVSNTSGTIDSEVVQLIVVSSIPLITSQSGDQDICTGEDLNLFVTITGDFTNTIWYNDNSGVVGFGNSIQINNIENTGEGVYSCNVENACGQAVSDDINIEVIELVNITEEPESQIICEGSDATFSITAVGENIEYKWLADGVEIVGENSNQLVIPNVIYPNSINYKAVAYNTCNSDTSIAVNIVINTYPEITGNPIEEEVCAGEEVSFIATATSTLAQTYQWYSTDNLIPDSISNTLTVTAISGTSIGYYCVISNSCGNTHTDTAYIYGRTPPEITQQPDDSTTCVGLDLSIDCKATGDEVIYYQWLFHGADVVGDNITGIETSTLQISSITEAQEGIYTCLVYNNCGEVLTDTAYVIVNIPPEILVQPEDISICEGIELTFDLQVNGTEPMEYEWVNQDNSQVMGSNQDLYIPNPTADDTGVYICNITNECGTETTDLFNVSINEAPVVLSSPEDISACQGDSIALIVESSGTEPIDFLWYRNSSAISWADNDTLIYNPANFASTGTYFCRLHNECGDIDSDPFFLHVGTPPTITWNPIDQTKCEFDTLNLIMGAEGENILYQWYFNNTAIEGETDTVLNIIQIDEDQTGTYYCAAYNACHNVYTDTIDVIVNPAPNLELGNNQEHCEGIQVVLSPDGDYQSYNWNNGLSYGAYLDVQLSGTYTLKVVGDNSCSNYDTVMVTFHPIHEVHFGNDTAACGSMILDAGTGAHTYSWSTGDNGVSSIYITNSGVYSVVTTGDEYGCEGADTIVIQVLETPEIDLGEDLNIGLDSTVTIGVEALYSTYTWSTGFSGPSLTIYGNDFGLGAHEIWIRVSTSNGCSDSDTVNLIVFNNQVIDGLQSGEYISLYPVPTSDILHIKGEIFSYDLGVLSIVNINGQEVYNTSIKHNGTFHKTIDVSGLESGMYFINYTPNNERTITRKIIVK